MTKEHKLLAENCWLTTIFFTKKFVFKIYYFIFLTEGDEDPLQTIAALQVQ